MSKRLLHYSKPLRYGPGIHIRRKFFTRDRAMLWTTYGIVSFFSIRYILGKLLSNVEIEQVPAAEHEDGHEHGDCDCGEKHVVIVDDEDALFVSMQFPKRLPKVLYKQSDPEWQEFSKFSRDAERQKAMRRELADKLRAAVAQTPPLAQTLGKDIKWSKMWLDVAYPDGPPPEYTRAGWLFLNDAIAWSVQTIPHSEYQQIRNILWPESVFRALRTSVVLFSRLQKIKVKGALGRELSQEEKQSQLAVQLHEQRKAGQATVKGSEKIEQSAQEKETEPVISPVTSRVAASTTGSNDSSMVEKAKGYILSVPRILVSNEFSMVASMFVGALVHNWNAAQLDRYPPGCCFVTGDVELTGSKARCKLSVLAAYDPKAQ